MTLLDKQIKIDLQERLNGREITAARNICAAIIDDISTMGLPCYFFGDRDAKTVVINLNPGESADKCDNAWFDRTNGFGTQLDSFIEKYIDRQTNYGIEHGVVNGKADSFDVKQAAFLTPWEDSGIGLSATPDWSREEYRMEAKTKVICNKLQLELVPYASAKFDINKKEITRFRPFVDTLLDEIFSKERKYIIFASAKFEDIFKDYNEEHPNTFDFIKEDITHDALKAGGTLKGKCSVVRINYKGKVYNALIAHTFPNQGLSKAYSLMQKYGEFCYKTYLNNTK